MEAVFIALAIIIGIAALGGTDSRAGERGPVAQATRAGTVISLGLFVLAYGLYSAGQPRTLRQALTDLVRTRLDVAMPLSIVTEWALLCGLWLLFGALHRVPARKLVRPVLAPAGAVLTVGWVLLPSVSLVLLLQGNPPAVSGADDLEELLALLRGTGAWEALIPMLVMLALPAGLAVLTSLSPAARQGTSARASARRPALPPAAAVTGLILIIVIVHVIVLWLITAVHHALPTAQGAAGVAVAAAAVMILLFLYWFRRDVLEPAGQAQPVFGFIDFTMALSALVIAVTGQARSPVTLGPVPPALVAAAPALVIAAWIFLRGLLPGRAAAAWRRCLIACLPAALAVYPVKLLLTEVLAPPLQHL